MAACEVECHRDGRHGRGWTSQGPGSLAKELGFVLRAKKDRERKQGRDVTSFTVILAAVWRVGYGGLAWKQDAWSEAVPGVQVRDGGGSGWWRAVQGRRGRSRECRFYTFQLFLIYEVGQASPALICREE